MNSTVQIALTAVVPLGIFSQEQCKADPHKLSDAF
jgi:hypothetical protein